MISEFHYNIVMKHKDRLDSAIVYDRDFKYNYFGFKTLERSYLLKINHKVTNYTDFFISYFIMYIIIQHYIFYILDLCML